MRLKGTVRCPSTSPPPVHACPTTITRLSNHPYPLARPLFTPTLPPRAHPWGRVLRWKSVLLPDTTSMAGPLHIFAFHLFVISTSRLQG